MGKMLIPAPLLWLAAAAIVAMLGTVGVLAFSLMASKASLADCRTDNMAHKLSIEGLRSGIELQNKAVREAQAISERMQAARDRARSDYLAAVAGFDAEIERILSQPASNSCEDVRLRLISEVAK